LNFITYDHWRRLAICAFESFMKFEPGLVKWLKFIDATFHFHVLIF